MRVAMLDWIECVAIYTMCIKLIRCHMKDTERKAIYFAN